MVGPDALHRTRVRRFSRRRAAICCWAALLPLFCSCRWSTDPADLTPLRPDDDEVATIDQVLATPDRAVQLVPDETLELHFTASLPVVELDGSPTTYRLLVFHSPTSQAFRIEVRSLPTVTEASAHAFVVPIIAGYRPDGTRLQTAAHYEPAGGLWKQVSLDLHVSGTADSSGPVYVLLGAATERIGEELWLLENPAEPGRAIMDWSERFSSSLCSLSGDLQVRLQFLHEPVAAAPPDPGGME